MNEIPRVKHADARSRCLTRGWCLCKGCTTRCYKCHISTRRGRLAATSLCPVTHALFYDRSATCVWSNLLTATAWPLVPAPESCQVPSWRLSRNKRRPPARHSGGKRRGHILSHRSQSRLCKRPSPEFLLFSFYFLPESVCKTFYGIGKLSALLSQCSLPNSIAIICKLPP